MRGHGPAPRAYEETGRLADYDGHIESADGMMRLAVSVFWQACLDFLLLWKWRDRIDDICEFNERTCKVKWGVVAHEHKRIRMLQDDVDPRSWILKADSWSHVLLGFDEDVCRTIVRRLERGQIQPNQCVDTVAMVRKGTVDSTFKGKPRNERAATRSAAG